MVSKGEDGDEWIDGRREGGTERGLRRWRKVRHRLHWQSPELQAEKERKEEKKEEANLLLTAGVHKKIKEQTL